MQSSTKQDRARVVLDTNIVVSALIAKEGASARLFEKLILGEMENYTNKEIILELKEVFGRKEITERTAKTARKFVIREYLNNSIQIAIKSKVNAAEHSQDNKFIETCLDADATYLITGDKHLLKVKEFRGIKIMTAKEFLERQY